MASPAPRFCPICEAHLDDLVCPRDGVQTVAAAVLTPVDPALGCVVGGRFRIERLIGEGASGRVYAATQLSLGHEIALKLVQTRAVADAQLVRRFYREARAASRLTSQHVVRVLDFGVDDVLRTPFIAMELLRGETLEQRLARTGPMRPAEAARLLAPVTRALVDATTAGIVHRDLKPSNIVIVASGDGTELVKVTDFGIAKDLRELETQTLTAQGAALGTPAYMAPEQVTGGVVDHRADLYALGCILYELVTGRRPFAPTTRSEVLLDHLLSPAPPLPSPLPSGEVAPPALGSLLGRLLAKSPSDRPLDAREVAASLDALAAAPVAPEIARVAQEGQAAAAPTAQPAPVMATMARMAQPVATPLARVARPVATPVAHEVPAGPPRLLAPLAAVWSWLTRRPLSPDEKLRRAARAKRRRWERHKRVFIAVNGGMIGINLFVAIGSGDAFPFSGIILALWGTALTLHGLGYRAWREEHAPLLGDDGAGGRDASGAEVAAGTRATRATSTWPALVARCRRAVERAEEALERVDAPSGLGTEPRLREGLADIERLARGAGRLEETLRAHAPDLEALDEELITLEASIAATADPRLKRAHEDNRALLLGKRQRLDALSSELRRMHATALSFALAAENIGLDAARLGAPRLYEYALDLQEPLRSLDDAVDILGEVERELDDL